MDTGVRGGGADGSPRVDAGCDSDSAGSAAGRVCAGRVAGGNSFERPRGDMGRGVGELRPREPRVRLRRRRALAIYSPITSIESELDNQAPSLILTFAFPAAVPAGSATLICQCEGSVDPT